MNFYVKKIIRAVSHSLVGMVPLLALSAQAQITFELDISEAEYPYIGSYTVEAEDGARCDIELTDNMRVFEGFKVEADETCPKPFDKAKAWILKPSGPTIQILGKWDHIIWNGSDADADGRFVGRSMRNEPFTLISNAVKQPRVTAAKNSLQKWEGIWEINRSKNRSVKAGPVVCAVALINEGVTAGLKPAVVDPGCIANIPQVRSLQNVMFWDDRPGGGKTASLYDRNGTRITQFSPFSGAVYVGNITGRSGKTRTYDWVKASTLNELKPQNASPLGRYELMPTDHKSRCVVHLSDIPDVIGQDASMPMQDCFMEFNISSWAMVEDRLTFYDNFREQTLSLRQVFPDYWVGVNNDGLTVTLGRSFETMAK
jgi:hypothetical protein